LQICNSLFTSLFGFFWLAAVLPERMSPRSVRRGILLGSVWRKRSPNVFLLTEGVCHTHSNAEIVGRRICSAKQPIVVALQRTDSDVIGKRHINTAACRYCEFVAADPTLNPRQAPKNAQVRLNPPDAQTCLRACQKRRKRDSVFRIVADLPGQTRRGPHRTGKRCGKSVQAERSSKTRVGVNVHICGGYQVRRFVASPAVSGWDRRLSGGPTGKKTQQQRRSCCHRHGEETAATPSHSEFRCALDDARCLPE